MKNLSGIVNIQKSISIFIIVLLVVGSIIVIPVKASGITTMSISGTGITNGASATGAAITPTITFTRANSVAPADTVTIVLNGIDTATNVLNSDITTGGTCSGTPTMTTITHPVSNITLSMTGITCSAGAGTVTIAAGKVVSDATGANNSIIITTPLDYGAFLYYVGSTNQVKVTATVTPTLSFTIRNTADSAEQATVGGLKTCLLGVLTTAAVGTCSYRLKVSTNAASGYAVSYKSDTRFTNGTYNFTDAAIGGSGTTITAGTEGYGIVLTPGASSSGATIARDNTNFGATAGTAYRITQTSGPYPVYTSNGTNAPSGTDTTNTALVAHQVAISAATPTGNYTHTITYTASATF
ncbi:MAG: hypothetical protein WCO33_02195 [bacterium]